MITFSSIFSVVFSRSLKVSAILGHGIRLNNVSPQIHILPGTSVCDLFGNRVIAIQLGKMGSWWSRVGLYDWYPYKEKRKDTETDTHSRECHVSKKMEIRVMHLQTK